MLMRQDVIDAINNRENSATCAEKAAQWVSIAVDAEAKRDAAYEVAKVKDTWREYYEWREHADKARRRAQMFLELSQVFLTMQEFMD